MKWELRWIEWGDSWWRSPVLDQALPWLTHLGSHLAVISFILLCWILTKRRKVPYRLVLLYGMQTGIIYGLKFLIRRERPFPFQEVASKLSRGPGEILDPSFPSAHTLYAFMMATLLAAWFPKYRILFFITAGLIGWTRIYLGLHYPTDVIAGGLLGYGITKVFLHYSSLTLPPH